MAFVLKKRIELEKFGSDWKGCYLEFAMPSYKQVKDMQAVEGDDTAKIDAVLKLIADMFIGGKGFDGNGIVDIKATELDQLPASILTDCFIELSGQVNPKSDET